MKYHWYIVLHQGGAQVYEQINVSRNLCLKFEIPNPAGKLKDREIASDKRGHVDSGQNSYAWTTDPAEQASVNFAKEIAEILKREESKGAFETLSIIAAPQMLGKIRAELPRSVQMKVREELAKNLGDMNESTVKDHLSDIQLDREPLHSV